MASVLIVIARFILNDLQVVFDLRPVGFVLAGGAVWCTPFDSERFTGKFGFGEPINLYAKDTVTKVVWQEDGKRQDRGAWVD